jgi:hypothetical protein
LKFCIRDMTKTHGTLEPVTPKRISKRKLMLRPNSNGLSYKRQNVAKVKGVEAYRNAEEADDEEEKLEDDIPIHSSATITPTTEASCLPMLFPNTGQTFINLTLDKSDIDVNANNFSAGHKGPTSRSIWRAMPARSRILKTTRKQATEYQPVFMCISLKRKEKRTTMEKQIHLLHLSPLTVLLTNLEGVRQMPTSTGIQTILRVAALVG